LSHGVKLYTKSDDYSGGFLTNPTVPARYKKLTSGTVTLGRHVIVGAGTVILPHVTVGDGASVGAMSLVTKTLDPWGIYFGCPVKRLKDRSKQLLTLEAQLLAEAPRCESSCAGAVGC
jgi:galactoside O-acetyltransferase